MRTKHWRISAAKILLVVAVCTAGSAKAVYICGDGLADPLSAQLIEIQQAHRSAMGHALLASPEPRDWLTSDLLDLSSYGADPDGKHRPAIVRRAIAASPNNSTVQWLALRNAYHLPDMAPAIAQILRNLQRIESDNGAVWLEVFENALSARRTKEAEAAIARMASATRFDDHSSDVLKAIVEAGQRFPLPDEYFSLQAQRDSASPASAHSKLALPYFEAINVATSTLPGYEPLLQSCKADFASLVKAASDTCSRIGRLMSAHGSNRAANRIGFVLLRESGRFDEDDVRRAREQDWVWLQKLNTGAKSFDEQSSAILIASTLDWIEANNELEAVRRELGREGKPLEPSTDWTDPISPFPARELSLHRSNQPKSSAR